MPINRNILRASLTRDIPFSELLEKSRKITATGATGEEKMALLDKLAQEIEEMYPLRKKEEKEE